MHSELKALFQEIEEKKTNQIIKDKNWIECILYFKLKIILINLNKVKII